MQAKRKAKRWRPLARETIKVLKASNPTWTIGERVVWTGRVSKCQLMLRISELFAENSAPRGGGRDCTAYGKEMRQEKAARTREEGPTP